jgi:hypothetical protein
MLWWHQKEVWYSHVFLYSFTFWIENALHPLICDVFIQTWKFLVLVWIFHPFFNMFLFGTTSLFIVQYSYKVLHKKLMYNIM